MQTASGKLRDWWPSNIAYQSCSSKAVHENSSCTRVISHGSTSPISSNSAASALITSAGSNELTAMEADPDKAPASSTTITLPSSSSSLTSSSTALRLSEVAAALNAMPYQPPSPSVSATTDLSAGNAIPSSSSLAGPTISRPIAKLVSTQSHKEELLRKLLCRSESSSDLQIGYMKRIKAPPLPLPATAVSTSSPSTPPPVVSMPSQLQAQQRQKEILASKAAQDVSDTFQARMPPTDARFCKLEVECSNGRKRKRDTPLTLQILDTPPKEPPLAKLELSNTQKEPLTRRQIHIYSERQRRKGMTHLYSILHSLLPDAKAKADRCTVLTDTIHFIHELQSRMDELSKKKSELSAEIGEQLNMGSATSNSLPQQAMADGAESALKILLRSAVDELSDNVKEEILSAADVAVRICGRDAFITLNSPKKRGVWPSILEVLHQQEMDLLNITLSSSNDMNYHCIHTKISSSASQLHSHDLEKILQEVVLAYAIKE